MILPPLYANFTQISSHLDSGKKIFVVYLLQVHEKEKEN